MSDIDIDRLVLVISTGFLSVSLVISIIGGIITYTISELKNRRTDDKG